MKQTLRDIFIWCTDTFGIAFLYRLSLRNRGPLVRIVVFHDVADREWFLRIVGHLCARYHVLTPEQFEAGEFHDTKINILLTFDDGYASWVRACAPVLNTYGIRGLFFVNAGILACAGDVGKSAQYMEERLHITPKEPLTFDGLAVLVAAGHTIGGHSYGHYRLTSLSPQMLHEEVLKDKAILEEKVGKRLVHFAYPFGSHLDYSPDVLAEVQRVGYTHVYTADGYFAHAASLEKSRLCILKNQPASSLDRWIGGSYDIYMMLKTLIT